ncbi:MacS family sensor histidine kinase [Tsukamurella sp. DT100]|uniref:MacS family sensor histidine kinase n=1 Tax=Tsukamurella sp. DT100 TaxID=3393415 RepID=UPI003CECDA6B
MEGLASRLRRVEPAGDAAGVRASDGDPRAPLWRGAQWFRALSVVYAVGRQIDEADRYQRIGWSWVMIGAVVAVSLIAGIGYVRGFGRNRWFVIGEFVGAAVLALGTVWVASPEFTAHNQALPTTLWLTNPVVSAAILGGPVAGMAGGIAIAVVNAIYRGTFPETIVRDANYPVFMAVGLGLGVAARVAIRSQEQLREAERVAAEARARERLAREVHDGVLQALAFLARRCAALGGPGTELGALGELAAQQERALRHLIAETPSAGPTGPEDEGTVDLRDLLRPLASSTVTLAEPGGAVLLPAGPAAEVAAAVRNALDNTALHAGPGARSYLLLEDLDDAVLVTVRDDGAGIAPGRLDAARAEGRLGVSESIVGRMRALGGRAELTTGVGDGVEWELSVPRSTHES